MQLSDHVASHSLSAEDLKQYIDKELLQIGLGVFDATNDEIQQLIDNPSSYVFADIVSRRSQTGWTTHGHSGECVRSRNAIYED